MLCKATKNDGSPCKGPATSPEGLCWAHDPANANQRKKSASKAGKGKPSRELTRLKDKVYHLIEQVESGDLETVKADKMLQGYRVITAVIELERKIREQEEVLA